MAKIPTYDECRALLREYGTLPHIVSHCEKTAEVALELARELNRRGYELSLELVFTAALLHDIARLEPRHAMRGAAVIAERGWRDTAEIVGLHMDLPAGRETEINEASVVFLADKLALENKRVSLRRRHENSCVRSDSEAMREYIWRRFETARLTERAVAKALGIVSDTL